MVVANFNAASVAVIQKVNEICLFQYNVDSKVSITWKLTIPCLNVENLVHLCLVSNFVI